MDNSTKRLYGEKGLGIQHGRVTIAESIDGRYLITIFKRGWLNERIVGRIWIDNVDDAMKMFNAIF